MRPARRALLPYAALVLEHIVRRAKPRDVVFSIDLLPPGLSLSPPAVHDPVWWPFSERYAWDVAAAGPGGCDQKELVSASSGHGKRARLGVPGAGG